MDKLEVLFALKIATYRVAQLKKMVESDAVAKNGTVQYLGSIQLAIDAAVKEIDR